MKIKLNSDVYNISKRIKNIDKNYYIVFNTSKQKFEVHNSSQIGTSYCLTLPYNCLDERTINYIHKTKSTNIENILKNIENNNRIIESTEKSSALNSVGERLQNIRR